MIEIIEANWPLILVALLIGLLIAWYVFHASRKTRVTGESKDVLDEGAAPAARNQALIDAPPRAAASPPSTQPSPAPTPTSATPSGAAAAGAAVSAASKPQTPPTPASDAAADDLTRIKGVGPKLAGTLREMGVTSFAQIAAWDDGEIDRIDAQLGRFQGRIRRDSWVEQAGFLARGDTAGFEEKFGRID